MSKSSIYRQYGTSKKLEQEGILFSVGVNANGDEATIRIARAGGSNVAFTKRAEAELKPYRRQLQNEAADPKVIDKVMQKVYSETVILGWENMEDRDGNPLPFSPEAAQKLFADLPDLWQDILKMSQNMALFRDEVREAESGN